MMKIKRIFLYNLSKFLERLCTSLDKGQLCGLYLKISIKLFGMYCPLAMWSYELDEKYKLNVWSDEQNK